MRSFDYDPRDILKNWEVKAQMQENGLLLNVTQHFSPADSASPSKILLGWKAISDIPQKKCSWEIRSSGIKEEIEKIELDGFELEVAPHNSGA